MEMKRGGRKWGEKRMEVRREEDGSEERGGRK